MRTFLITYELIFQEDGPYYVEFINKIKGYGYWANPVKGTWLIKSVQDLSTVINYLRASLLKGDKILIIEVNNHWISQNLDKDVIDWMKDSL